MKLSCAVRMFGRSFIFISHYVQMKLRIGLSYEEKNSIALYPTTFR